MEDLRLYFKTNEPNLSDATINWRVYDLVKSSVLRRTGRGLFELGSVSQYLPELDTRAIKISKHLQKNFADVTFCIWNSDLINEFSQHMMAYPFILLDVERAVAESVYHFLKDKFNGVFLRPPEALINDIIPDCRRPVIIRYLTTESPLNEHNQLPLISLEKMLVDVFCDVEFSFLEGSERRAIFQNAYYKYTINENKLLRYAARKGRRTDIQKYIDDGGFTQQNFKLIYIQ